MIGRLRAGIRRRWPPLRLRTILFATLFVVAALPGFGAIFLRVYENTLVRQTEAELVAQGAALAAAAAADWPGGGTVTAAAPPTTQVDLSTASIHPERPAPAAAGAPAPDALGAAARLAPVLAATRATTLASILLLDRNGVQVTDPGKGGSYAALPEVASARRGRPMTVLRRSGAYRAVYRFEWLSRAAAIRIHHARPIVVNGRVVGVLLLSRSARALFRGLYEDRGKIMLGVALILGVLVVLTGVISRGITRPIERLGVATRAVAAGRGSVPEVPPTAATEIQGLYADFATMAAAIERRSRYLRDVAYAVSHEFKTPLAGIRGAIELLQDHGAGMATPERERFLRNAAADAERLTQLITRLLDLARADMMPALPDATAQVGPVLARIADAQGGAGFALVGDVPDALPPVAMAPAALETVIATLAENGRQAGAMQVCVAARIEAGQIVLHVADDGPGIAPADRERLFEPFFTTRRAAGGTGLGLTIARSLLDAAGGSIVLVEGEGGAAFELRLPEGEERGGFPRV